jgi:GrpB-like predicted nucleotidyltransferase (UPF0157 family)
MIGLEKDVVRLVPYNPEWSRLFEEERARLQAVLGGRILDILHVGGTAIPGCVAKPILDIAVGVENFEQAFVCVPLIERLGYDYEGENGIPRRHFFVKRNPPGTHHVHVNEIGGRNWLN